MGVNIAEERCELRSEDKGVSYSRSVFYRFIAAQHVDHFSMFTCREQYRSQEYNTFPTNDL